MSRFSRSLAAWSIQKVQTSRRSWDLSNVGSRRTCRDWSSSASNWQDDNSDSSFSKPRNVVSLARVHEPSKETEDRIARLETRVRASTAASAAFKRLNTQRFSERIGRQRQELNLPPVISESMAGTPRRVPPATRPAGAGSLKGPASNHSDHRAPGANGGPSRPLKSRGVGATSPASRSGINARANPSKRAPQPMIDDAVFPKPAFPTSRLATLVRTTREAELAVARLEQSIDSKNVCAVDTETIDVDPTAQSPVWNGKVVCFSIYMGPTIDFTGCGETIRLLPSELGGETVRGQESEADHISTRLWVDATDPEVIEVFKPWFENPEFKKVFHNYSFDSHVLANHGIDVQGFQGDTIHMARLWDTSRTLGAGYSLSALSQEYLGWGKTDMKKAFGRPKLKKDGTPGKLMTMPNSLELQTADDPEMFSKWVEYSTFDTVCTWFLYRNLKHKLTRLEWFPDIAARKPATISALLDPSKVPKKKFSVTSTVPDLVSPNLYDFYTLYWREFGQVLVDMEREGMYLDCKFLNKQAEAARSYRDHALQQCRRWVASLCADGVHFDHRGIKQRKHLYFSLVRVKIIAKKPLAHKISGKVFNPEEEYEIAWTDAQELIAARKAVLIDTDPHWRAFDIANTEEIIEEGATKPKAFRKISLKGLGLKPVSYTSTGEPSLSGEVIKKLAGKPFQDPPKWGTAYHDLGGGKDGEEACKALAWLLEAEATEKLLSTFIETLPTLTDSESRIHTSVNLNTETGRLSSRRPNLQNQPALDKDVYHIRQAFSHAPGNKLIVADYGQLELRVLAHMAKCESMISAFKLGGDFHSRTAIDMYPHIQEAIDKGEVLLEWDESKGDSPKPQVKQQFATERKRAKTLNFSIAYGKTKVGLAKDFGVTVAEAEDTISKWYAARHEVKAWQETTIKNARLTGYTTTLLGRRRKLDDINSAERSRRGHAERAAINTPIQGGAADIVIAAMLKISKSEELKDLNWKMIMQIHDELVLEGPIETCNDALAIVLARTLRHSH